MSFDLGTALAVQERDDGLLEVPKFDLSTAMPVEEIRAARPGEISPNIQPLTEEQKAQANVELTYGGERNVPSGLKFDWMLTSKPAQTVSETALMGGINLVVQGARALLPDETVEGNLTDKLWKSIVYPETTKKPSDFIPGIKKLPKWSQITISVIDDLASYGVAGFGLAAIKSEAKQMLFVKDIERKIASGQAAYVQERMKEFLPSGPITEDVAKTRFAAEYKNEFLRQATAIEAELVSAETKIGEGTLVGVGSSRLQDYANKRSLLGLVIDDIRNLNEAGQIRVFKVGDVVGYKNPEGIIEKAVVNQVDKGRILLQMGASQIIATPRQLSQLEVPKSPPQPTEGKVIFKGVGGEQPNINQFAYGTHYAENPELAYKYARTNTPQNIQAVRIKPDAKIIDLEDIKLQYAQEMKMADPTEITKKLRAEGYDIAKAKMPDGQYEYIVLNNKAVEPLYKPNATNKQLLASEPFDTQAIKDAQKMATEQLTQGKKDLANVTLGRVKALRENVLKEQALSTPEKFNKKEYDQKWRLVEPMKPVSETKLQPPPIQMPPQPPTPPKTPIPPSEPPPEGSMPQEPDSVKKVIQALKEAKPIRAEQEALYTAERGRRIAKGKAMFAKLGGEEGAKALLGSLKGELPKAQFETLRGKITQENIGKLFTMIRDSKLNDWEKVPAITGLGKLFGEFGGEVPTEGELKLLHEVFGKEFTDALLENRTMLQKFMYASGEILNLPRTVMASFDLSAPLRQGVFLVGRQKQFAPAFIEMFKYFASEKSFGELMKNIESHPLYEIARKHGLALTDMDAGLTNREEKFMSSWGEVIPGVRASGRAYTGFLNKIRFDVFVDLYNKAKSLGVKETDKFLNDLTEYINTASGRGKFPGKLDDLLVALNSVFFSPRLMASRIQLLNPTFYWTKDPFVRKEALKDLVTTSSIWLTILGLAGLAGLTVGTDWRSSDFAKIKIGNTRIDIGGGFQQYLRSLGQIITGEYISSSTGKVMTLGEGYRALNRWDILIRQLEAKESPILSFVVSLFKGKTFIGEDVNVAQELLKRITPMVIGDMIDLAKENPALLPLGALGIFGVGLQSYENKPMRSSSTRSSSVKKSRSSSTK